MKKYLIWSILYALCNVFILTSCGGNDDEPEYNPQQPVHSQLRLVYLEVSYLMA